MEKWKAVTNFEGYYEVSDRGNIKSLHNYRKNITNRILKPWKTKKGYLAVTLRKPGIKKSFLIHQIVMFSFKKLPKNGYQVAHNNGIPYDNRLSNLRYVTPAENIEDRRRHGRTARGSRSGTAKLDEAVVRTLLKLKNIKGLSISELAHLACVNRITVERIFKGESWKHVQ